MKIVGFIKRLFCESCIYDKQKKIFNHKKIIEIEKIFNFIYIDFFDNQFILLRFIEKHYYYFIKTDQKMRFK